MTNFGWLEFMMEQEMARADNYNPALVELLEDLRREQKQPSLRSRLAGLAMGFALRLDPEVAGEPAPRLTLEGANVRG